MNNNSQLFSNSCNIKLNCWSSKNEHIKYCGTPTSVDGTDRYRISNKGPKNSCSIIHPNTSCAKEVVVKCASVLKKSTKLYVVLYLAMFAFQFKRIKREKKVGKSVGKYFKDFLGSLAFMSWLVGGMKTALCMLNAIGSPLDGNSFLNLGRIMPLLSFLGSTSIFFNNNAKRSEISYFVFVRACRSAYIYFKKRFPLPIQSERELCFIGIFTLISYLFFECDR